MVQVIKQERSGVSQRWLERNSEVISWASFDRLRQRYTEKLNRAHAQDHDECLLTIKKMLMTWTKWSSKSESEAIQINSEVTQNAIPRLSRSWASFDSLWKRIGWRNTFKGEGCKVKMVTRKDLLEVVKNDDYEGVN